IRITQSAQAAVHLWQQLADDVPAGPGGAPMPSKHWTLRQQNAAARPPPGAVGSTTVSATENQRAGERSPGTAPAHRLVSTKSRVSLGYDSAMRSGSGR